LGGKGEREGDERGGGGRGVSGRGLGGGEGGGGFLQESSAISFNCSASNVHLLLKRCGNNLSLLFQPVQE
jgi:hypothetical protein